jgi:hypothetical protein
MMEQLLRLARIFAGHDVGFAQHAQSAQRDVFEIADGSGDQVQASDSIVCGARIRHCSMKTLSGAV